MSYKQLKKKENYYYRIKMDPYDRSIDFIFSEDISFIETRLQRIYGKRKYHSIFDTIKDSLKKGSNCTKGLTIANTDGSSLIWLPVVDLSDADWYGTLSHEILHAIFDLFRHIDIGFSRECDEAYTYLLSNITTKILLKLNSVNNKQTSK